MNIRTRVLEPEEFYLLEPLIEAGAPPLDPDWSRVIASIDQDSGQIVGFIALQMILHAEPIVIKPEFREQGLWRELAEFTDGYLRTIGVRGIYNQPTNEKAEAICEKMGMVRSDYPLWVKTYPVEAEVKLEGRAVNG